MQHAFKMQNFSALWNLLSYSLLDYKMMTLVIQHWQNYYLKFDVSFEHIHNRSNLDLRDQNQLLLAFFMILNLQLAHLLHPIVTIYFSASSLFFLYESTPNNHVKVVQPSFYHFLMETTKWLFSYVSLNLFQKLLKF